MECNSCHKLIPESNYYNHTKYLCVNLKSENIKCEHCDKLCRNKILYKKHINEFHGGSVICNKCRKIYKNKNSYYSHKKSCTMNIKRNYKRKCGKCQKQYTNITNHKRFCGSDKCRLCMIKVNNLEEHMKVYHTSYLKCDKCDTYCKNENTLKFHQRSHDPKNTAIYICDQCDRNFIGPINYKRHCKTHILIKCDKCDKKYGSRSIKNHIKNCKGKEIIIIN